MNSVALFVPRHFTMRLFLFGVNKLEMPQEGMSLFASLVCLLSGSALLLCAYFVRLSCHEGGFRKALAKVVENEAVAEHEVSFFSFSYMLCFILPEL